MGRLLKQINWERENEGLGRLQLAIKEDRTRATYESISNDVSQYIQKRDSLYDSYNDRRDRYLAGEYLKDSANEFKDSGTATLNEVNALRDALRSKIEDNKAGLDYLYGDFASNLLEDFDNFDTNVKSMTDFGAKEYAYWSGITDENDWKEKVKATEEAQKQLQELIDYDISAGEGRIGLLESEREDVKQLEFEKYRLDLELGKLKKEWDDRHNLPEYTTDEENANFEAQDAIKAEIAAIDEQLRNATASFEYLGVLIDSENEKIEEARRVQAPLEFENAALNDSEFEYYSNLGAQMEGNAATKKRGKAEKDIHNMFTDNALEDDDFVAMTNDEYAVYNYLLAKNGRESAEAYFDTLDERITARQAVAEANGIDGNWFYETMYGFNAGLDQFWQGMKGFGYSLTGETYIKDSKAQQVMSILQENNKEQYGDFGGTIVTGAQDLAMVTGNMLPSVAASLAIGALSKSAGGALAASQFGRLTSLGQTATTFLQSGKMASFAGNLLMGTSAGGNAYSQAIKEGYSPNEARVYGALIGVSEVTLQKVLGGIDAYGSESGIFQTLTNEVLGSVDNAFARIALEYGGKMADEALEEGLQEILEPLFSNMVLGTDKDIDWGNVAEAAILGGLSAGMFDVGGAALSKGISTAITGVNNAKLRSAAVKNAKAIAGTTENIGNLANAVLQTDSRNKNALKVQEKIKAGKSLSDNEILRLVYDSEKASFTKVVNSSDNIRGAITVDMATVLTATDNKLTAKNAGLIASAASKAQTGMELSDSEITALMSSTEAINRARGNIAADTISSASGMTQGQNVAQASVAENKAAASSKDALTSDGGQSVSKANEEVKEAQSEVKDYEDEGVITVRLTMPQSFDKLKGTDNEKVKALSKDFGDYAREYELIYKYGAQKDVYAYDRGFRMAYDMGAEGIKVSELNNNPEYADFREEMMKLPPIQRALAYKMGQIARTNDMLQKAAKKLNLKIKYEQLAEGQDGYRDEKGVIHVSYDSQNPLMTVIKHELWHYVALFSKNYNDIESAILQSKAFKAWVTEKKGFKKVSEYESYLRDKYRDSDTVIQEEMAAHFVGENFFPEEGDITHFAEKMAAELGKSKMQRLFEAIKDFFKSFKQKIRNAFTKNSHTETELLKLEKIFTKEWSKIFKKLDAAETKKASTNKGEGVRYSFVGYAEDGKGKYKSNFPKGTPKIAKSERILTYIKDVWSKKPIKLNITDERGNVLRTIEAQFDPTYDESGNEISDATKLMGGNRHGTASEQRVTLDLADDYYQIASESKYNYSKLETGKELSTHNDVTEWHYFVNDIYFSEYDSEDFEPYRVSINVKEKSQGNFVYSFSAEKNNETNTPQTLHAVVKGTESSPDAYLVTNSISNSSGNVKSKNSDSGQRSLLADTLASDTEGRDSVKKAEQYFGTTKNIKEAGYLLTDGKLLDFSGRNNGATGGYRTVDHREITDALGDDYGASTNGMVKFMQEGNIRLSPESGGINLSVKPNATQINTLSDYISRYGGEVILDIDNEYGDTAFSMEYPRRTSVRRILSDINNYFDKGIIPNETSPFGEFRYMLADENKAERLLGMYENGQISREEYLAKLKNQKETPLDLATSTPEIANTTPELNKKTGKNRGDKQSNFYDSFLGSSIFDERFKAEAESDDFIKKYSSVTNRATLAEAAAELDAGGEAYVRNWWTRDTSHSSLIDIAVGMILLDRYQRVGDIQSGIAAAQKLREMGTAGGQQVQIFSILERFSPEMMEAYAQHELDKAWERLVKLRSQKWIDENAKYFKLTEDDSTFIREKTIQAMRMPENSRQRAIALGEIAARIQEKIPPARGQGYKAWQRTAMLLNVRTNFRNILGNLSVVPVFIASDFFGTGIDKALTAIYGRNNADVQRTTGFNIFNTPENLKAAGKGFIYSFDDLKRGIKTRQESLDRWEFDGSGKSFNEHHKLEALNKISKVLNKMDDLTSTLLEAGDRAFYEAWFINSLNDQMRLNNVDEPTPEMVEIASEIALQRTWQDNTAFAKAASKIKSGLNEFASIYGVGLGDVFIKFTKTPANLARASVMMSPVGMIKGLTYDLAKFNSQMKKGVYDAKLQRQIVKDISDGFVGTIIWIAAVALKSAGLISGGGDEDDDVQSFEKNIAGYAPYSLTLGGKSYSYEWMQPIAGIFAAVADAMDSATENPENEWYTNLLEGMQAMGNVLLEQSFMQSVAQLFEADPYTHKVNYVANAGRSILSETTVMIPQIIAQTASAVDEYQRYAYDENVITDTVNDIKMKIPGLRETLPKSVDVMGQDVINQKSGIFNAFINPANVYPENATDTAKEIYRLYKATGNAALIPARADKSITVKGIKTQLSSEERLNYQSIMGQCSCEIFTEAMKNERYSELTDEEKSTLLDEIYSYSKDYARSKFAVSREYLAAMWGESLMTEEFYKKLTDEQKQKWAEYYLLSDYIDSKTQDSKIETTVSDYLIDGILDGREVDPKDEEKKQEKAEQKFEKVAEKILG